MKPAVTQHYTLTHEGDESDRSPRPVHLARPPRPRSDGGVHQEQLRLRAVRGGMPGSCPSLLYEGRGAVPLDNSSAGLVFPEKVCVIYREGAGEETERREGAPDNTLV